MTEYYMLMYIWAQVPQCESKDKSRMISDWRRINRDNITLVEYYLVKKSDIFDYLEKCGFDKERLRKGVEYFRMNPDKKKVLTDFGFKFVTSRQFKESPVNVCIEKSVYNKICKAHRFIGKYDYESFKTQD